MKIPHRFRFVPRTLVLLGTFLLFACQRGPEKSLEHFYRQVEAGDYDSAAEMISKTLVAMVGKPKLVAGLQQQNMKIKEKGGIARITVSRKSELKDLADVHSTIEYRDKSTEEDDVRLVREDGRWKIAPKK